MKPNSSRLARSSALIPLALAALAPSARAQQPFDTSAWSIKAAESRVETYRGRSALLLREGAAWLKGSHFQNGTIEFDIAFSDALGFPGIAFRAATHDDYELFYLREDVSGPHATQYTPVLHGLYAWQIYAGPAWEGSARWTYDRWMHVKLVVSGSRAELVVDGDSVQVIPRLRGPEGAGEVGFVVVPGAMRIANLVVRPEPAPPVGAALLSRDSTPATIVRTWRVSTTFAESLLTGVRDLAAVPGGGPQTWHPLAIEERGIANLARLAGNGSGRNTVVAAVTITSDRARTVPVRFGFSDRVRVYLNGRMLYAGNDGFGSHDPEFLGIVGLFDVLVLPLKRGPNELWFAVSETFGGWAITADLPDRDGIAVSP
jgi:hypothetical protein